MSPTRRRRSGQFAYDRGLGKELFREEKRIGPSTYAWAVALLGVSICAIGGGLQGPLAGLLILFGALIWSLGVALQFVAARDLFSQGI